jgi:hypothetical protein
MPATDALVQLLADLHTNTGLQAAFIANPGGAVENYALTAHERDAVVTRDLDDFVALGLVTSISQLLAVLRGGGPSGPVRPSIPAWLQRLIDRILRRRRPPHIDPRPRPRPVPDPRPLPGPGPLPAPDPVPDPRPGPDPPPPGG